MYIIQQNEFLFIMSHQTLDPLQEIMTLQTQFSTVNRSRPRYEGTKLINIAVMFDTALPVGVTRRHTCRRRHGNAESSGGYVVYSLTLRTLHSFLIRHLVANDTYT